MTIHVDISVVVGSNKKMIFDCLETFIKYSPSDYIYNIIVTCNQPNTDIPERLRKHIKIDNLKIIENIEPKGFAENHNAILERSNADYIFILNDDLVFLPDAVGRMLDFMKRPENYRVAALSPKLVNPNGSLQPSTYSFPSFITALISVSGLRSLIPFSPIMNKLAIWMGLGNGKSRFWSHDKTVDVDTFRGACVLVRMKAVHEVGYMNTLSLVGGEETEWHYRFRQQGWRVVFYPEAEVIHYGQQTTGVNPALCNEYLKSLLYFFKKHRSNWFFYVFKFTVICILYIRLLWDVISNRSTWAKINREGIRAVHKIH